MSKVSKFKMQSAGAAYDLDIGFVPETVTVWNWTKWASDGVKVMFVWHRGMTAGHALSEIADDTGINRALETSNGFTPYDASNVNDAQEVVSAITAANPAVVTVSSTSGWKVGDSTRFRGVAGMTEVNGNIYKIKQILSSTTLSLEVDASSFSAYTSGGVIYNLSTAITDSGFTGITLGSTVICANDDILFVECVGADSYADLGDLA